MLKSQVDDEDWSLKFLKYYLWAGVDMRVWVLSQCSDPVHFIHLVVRIIAHVEAYLIWGDSTMTLLIRAHLVLQEIK